MLNKIRKNLKDKAGFTLVELIVVLVILAILAAMLVPALTGYIDKANKEKVTAECRQVVMAAQTEISTLYGKAQGGKLTQADLDKTVDTKTLAQRIEALSETKGKFAVTVSDDGVVKNVKYQNSNWVAEYVVGDNGGSYNDPVKATVDNKVTTNSVGFPQAD